MKTRHMNKYTIHEVAKMADVSVRTLHHYDQIGLLSAVRSDNGYRKYGEKELLKLQQILFYKELDFSLEQIKAILAKPNFDISNALKQHKELLHERIERLNSLINTIDKTILHINKETMITDEDLYAGFSKEQKERYDKEAREKYGDKAVDDSIKKAKGMTKEQFEKSKVEGEAIGKDLAGLMESHKSESDEVQAVVARHYEWVKLFWTPNQEAYKGLGDLYVSNPEFKAFYDNYKPGLAEFLKAGMIYYADKNLS